MTYKILIATRSFGSTSTKPWEMLELAGCDLVKADMSRDMTEERLMGLLAEADGAIVGVVPMTARVLERSPRLKVVSMHGVGVDHIDVTVASRLGIVVANCVGTNDQAVADLTVGLMISIARSIPRVDQDLRAGGWGRYKGVELWNKTLGLVGFGKIGRAVAKRALGFDMRVLVYDPYVEVSDLVLQGIDSMPLDEVIKRADYLSLHAPLNADTQHMIGEPQFEAMKSTAYLINTARGGLVDELALYAALTENQIAGAALDVYALEPPVDSPLLGLSNVVVTPHVGAHTREAIERTSVMAVENVLRTLEGGQPHHRVV
jgi:D-3-phosphoglycerate dehydrogenase